MKKRAQNQSFRQQLIAKCGCAYFSLIETLDVAYTKIIKVKSKKDTGNITGCLKRRNVFQVFDSDIVSLFKA